MHPECADPTISSCDCPRTLHTDGKFPARSTTVKTTDPYTYEFEFTGLKYTTYYVRVRAEKPHGYVTDYSDTVMVTLSDVVGVEDMTGGDDLKIVRLDADNIEILGISDFESIIIYSVLGQKIVDYKSGSYSNNSGMVLNVSDLSNGTYLLKICCKTCFKILKFQK